MRTVKIGTPNTDDFQTDVANLLRQYTSGDDIVEYYVTMIAMATCNLVHRAGVSRKNVHDIVDEALSPATKWQ